MRRRLNLIPLIYLLLIGLQGYSQQRYVPLYFSKTDTSSGISTVKPEFQKFPDDIPERDTSRSWVYRKLVREHFIRIANEGLHMTLDPLMSFAGGPSTEKDKLLYRNTRGINISGRLGKHVSFTSSFYETQLTTPKWMDRYHRVYAVLPGETNPKGYGNGGYDLGSVYGRFSVRQDIGKWHLTFSSGYDDWFIGRGYRSLFLSDFSLPWFFGHVKIHKGALTYHHITGSVQNPNFRNIMQLPGSRDRLTTSAYQKKTMSYHYLQWKPTAWIAVGFFEATAFRVTDTSHVQFKASYINPVPFSNMIAYGMNDANNVFGGLDLCITLTGHFSFYSQVVADRFRWQWMAWQGSLRYDNTSWHLLAEINTIGEYTYSHKRPLQNFSHYNQSITHPMGNNLDEVIGSVVFSPGKWEFGIRSLIISKGDNTLFDGLVENNERNLYQFHTGTIRHILNPNTRLQLFGAVTYYHSNNGDESFIRFGLKTQLRNDYPEVLPE